MLLKINVMFHNIFSLKYKVSNYGTFVVIYMLLLFSHWII